MDTIEKLIKKGSENLNMFFYIGIFVGVLLGPLVVVLSFFPSVTNVIASDARNLTVMRGFGIGISILFLIASIEQYVKVKKDNFLLAAYRGGFSDLIWVYKQVSTGNIHQSGKSHRNVDVATFYHVIFRFTNKKSYLVWLSNEEADELIRQISAQFKNVSTGYSEEIKAHFNVDPEKLRFNPIHVNAEEKLHGSVRV